MTFLLVIAVAVLVMALIHLVSGWFLSKDLYRDALAVHTRPKELGVRVRELTRDWIVLEAPVPRWDIGHPGTLGLAWDDGYARLGDVIDVKGSRFVRHYEPLWGEPPLCTGPLEDCPPVEIDPYAYPHDPTDVGLEFETISYPSPVGSVSAWLVPARTKNWAVLCHGWTAEKRELIRMLPAIHDAGFNSLVIDYRNDPGAPRDVTGRYRFGLSEWEDLEAAVDWVSAGGVDSLVVGGCSTGGALVMAFLERSPRADSVSGVFLDAPNVILTEAIRHATRDLRATSLMIEFGMWIADLRWKIDWEATNYVRRAGEILTVPTLVFHGTSDQTIPISVSRQLEARVPAMVELVETPAAGHVMSWNADPARYERYLRNFLDRV
jgi:uncharacterized protein